MLGLRPPGLEFRILCLEDSVISFISPSSGGSPGPVCAQRWPKARFISFHFPTSLNGHSRCIDIDISSFLTYRSVSQSGGGGGPRVVVSTAAFHARVRGTVPGLGGLKETKMFLPHPRVKVSIVGSLRDREVACSASDRQGSNLESCV